MKKSDFHIHTILSPCAKEDAIISNYFELAKQENLYSIGFSDHLWDENIEELSKDEWYSACRLEKIITLKDKLPKEYNGIKVYFGCEAEINENGELGITKSDSKLFDYVLIPMSHFHMPFVSGRRDINDIKVMHDFSIERFLYATNYNLPVSTCICHPFLACGVKNLEGQMNSFTDKEYEICFSEAKRKNISIEISSAFIDKRKEKFSKFDSSGFASEYIRMITIANNCGCKFQFGSDAHFGSKFLVHDEMVKFAEACGIEDNSIISEM